MTPIQSTNRLSELLCRKLRLLEEILSLCEAQQVFVERDEIDSLMKVLAAKQGLLDQLQAFQSELASYRDEDPQSRVWQTPERRGQTQIVAGRCEQILKQIMEIERQCEARLLVRRDEVAADLRAADSASEARHAYVAASSSHSGGGLSGGFNLVSDA